MAKSRIRLFNQARSSDPAKADAAVVARDRSMLFNQLALLFVVLTPLVLIVYGLIFIFPQLPINPLPPIQIAQPAQVNPVPTRVPTGTSTPTRTLHPTNTPTATPTPEPSGTPTLSGSVKTTLRPGSTATPSGPRTPTVTRSPFNYTAELIYQRAQLYGSNWAGVAGLVLDSELRHLQNIGVHAWGDDPLGPDGQFVLSGTYVQYGPSGWEFTLGDKPAFGTWHVQLIDDNNNPLSSVVDIVMNGDPRANLAYIIFEQNH